jgi:hypothetical protein
MTGLPPGVQSVSGQLLNPNAMLESATLYCFGVGTITGGTVAPVMLGPDGVYYPIAATTTLTTNGFILLLQLTTSALGLAFQIGSPVTGGGSLTFIINALLI